MREFLLIFMSLVVLFATYDVYKYQKEEQQKLINELQRDYSDRIKNIKQSVEKMKDLESKCMKTKDKLCIGSTLIYNDIKLETTMISMYKKELVCESNHDLMIYLMHNIIYENRVELMNKVLNIKLPEEITVNCDKD